MFLFVLIQCGCASAVLIDAPLSPSKKFKIVEIVQITNKKKFCIQDNSNNQIIANIYEESDVGYPPVTKIIARWSANETFLVVNVELLKTCSLAVFQINSGKTFKKLELGIPETQMLQDIDERKFGFDLKNNYRINGDSCTLGKWVDDSKISARISVNLVNDDGNFETYATSFDLISENGEMKINDLKILGLVANEQD